MADVQLKCDNCGKTVTASEFVDYSTVVCKLCGGRISRPNATVDPDAAMKYRLKSPMSQHSVAAAGGGAEPLPAQETVPPPATIEALPLHRRFHFRHEVAGWVLFVILGIVMGLIRYGGVWSSPFVTQVLGYGPYFLLLVHIIIVLRAFKETIFYGVLCLLVPMYSFYYLFLITDAFYLRAIVAGLLVGIGQDSALFYQDVMAKVIHKVQAYIASGG